MTDDRSPVVRDIFMTEAVMCTIDEDSLSHINLSATDFQMDEEVFNSPFDIFSSNYINDETIVETTFDGEFLSDSSSDFPHMSLVPVSSSSIYNNFQQHIISGRSLSTDADFHPRLPISFSNPPEPFYHVRYLSEITTSPPVGNIVNTKKKTKKNTSGRYLKGTHGRHVTIDLSIHLPDHHDCYIRVTRLIVPYQNVSYIHPYPLLYSKPTKKTNLDVQMKSSSIYYKLNKEDICSHSKQFPNIILTRLKQCELKDITILEPFDKALPPCKFIGNTPKAKIATFQLKKSQLDFRLAIFVPQTGEYLDTNIFCRSNALIEEEGTECKKLLLTSSLEF